MNIDHCTDDLRPTILSFSDLTPVVQTRVPFGHQYDSFGQALMWGQMFDCLVNLLLGFSTALYLQ